MLATDFVINGYYTILYPIDEFFKEERPNPTTANFTVKVLRHGGTKFLMVAWQGGNFKIDVDKIVNVQRET